MRNALGFLRMSSFVDLSASDDESASGVSSHSSDGCRSVRTLRKRHVRALLGLREDVGRGSVQLSDHSPTRREEDPYLAPEEKKRRLTNLEAMAETRRQQLLDNCVETIDLTTANYQPTFRTASSNQTRGPHLPLQRPPCVSHLPAVWAAAAAWDRSAGSRPLSRTHHRVPQVPRLYAMVHWPRTSCRRWSPLPRLRRAPFSIRH